MDIATFKSVAEIGISSTIAVIFLRQQQKLFGQQEQVIQVLTKLERNLNSDIIKGQALEQCLILKIHEMRWGVQNKLINYIEHNHLQKNWNIIVREIDTYFNSKFVEFDDEMKDIVDNSTFKIVKMILIEEFTEVKYLLIQLLDSLRVNRVVDKELYNTSKRAVIEHMDNIENQLKQKIRDVI